MAEKIKKITGMRLFMPIVCLFIVLLVNVIRTPDFFNITLKDGQLSGWLIDVINRGSELVILAIGMTLVTAASGGQDISVGAVMAVAAAVCCQILSGGEVSTNTLAAPIIIAAIAGILVAALCGAFNGFLVAKLNIQPMVATLILFTAGRGIAQLVTQGQITYVRVESYKAMGGFLGPIPTPVIFAVAAVIVAYYVICGALAGLAGIVASSRIYSADANNIGLNLEMDAILAVALGGNILSGGKFSLMGSVIGAYTIQALTTTLYAMSVPSDQLPVYKAIVVIIIVVLQSPVYKKAMQNYKAKRQSKKAVVQGGEQ